MLKKEAKKVTGGLSGPSKLPGKAWGTPAELCKVGSILRNLEESVCSDCYALKGAYRWPVVKNAYQRRYDLWLRALVDIGSFDHWVDAMVCEITGQEEFRWFDSGDLESGAQLGAVCLIAKRLPETKFWLATKEKRIVLEYFESFECPQNLVIRLSGAMVDGPVPISWPHRSVVVTSLGEEVHKRHLEIFSCPAPDQGNECGDCRACWNPEIATIAYRKH